MIRTTSNIIRLSKAGGRVKEAQDEIIRLTKEKQAVEKKLAESQTDEYTERIAREKLGLGKPGEIVVIMEDEPEVDNGQWTVDKKIPNWKLWRKLYLGF